MNSGEGFEARANFRSPDGEVGFAPAKAAAVEHLRTETTSATFDARTLEEQQIIQGLNSQLESASFATDAGPDGRTTFALTPQGIRWLERHPKSLWTSYLIQRYRMQLYPAAKQLGSSLPICS